MSPAPFPLSISGLLDKINMSDHCLFRILRVNLASLIFKVAEAHNPFDHPHVEQGPAVRLWMELKRRLRPQIHTKLEMLNPSVFLELDEFALDVSVFVDLSDGRFKEVAGNSPRLQPGDERRRCSLINAEQ